MNGTDIPNALPEPPVQIVYVWTGTGSIMPLEVPLDLLPQQPKAAETVEKVKSASRASSVAGSGGAADVERFDNLRRMTSGVNQYSEIPTNNIVSTRKLYEPVALFNFRVEPNKKYRLNINIRARTDYKFTVPILARYYLEATSPALIKEYRATYVSSNETVNGAEKTSNTLGSTMIMTVDSVLSIIKITATFIGGALATEIRVHHGIKTDDPDATLYCLAGSNGVLSEVAEFI